MKQYKKPQKYNSMSFGFITGFSLPLIIAVIFYFLNVERFGGSERLLYYIKTIDITSKLLSLFVIPDLLLFFIFIWKNRIRAAQGVLMATFIYAFIIVAMQL